MSDGSWSIEVLVSQQEARGRKVKSESSLRREVACLRADNEAL